jgi:hypothetical protein
MENKSYWITKSPEYPYRAKAPIGAPSPDNVTGCGFFLAVPFKTKGECWWGFQTLADREQFLRLYPEAREW